MRHVQKRKALVAFFVIIAHPNNVLGQKGFDPQLKEGVALKKDGTNLVKTLLLNIPW